MLSSDFTARKVKHTRTVVIITGIHDCETGAKRTGASLDPTGVSCTRFELNTVATNDAGRYNVDIDVSAFTVLESFSRPRCTSVRASVWFARQLNFISESLLQLPSTFKEVCISFDAC